VYHTHIEENSDLQYVRRRCNKKHLITYYINNDVPVHLQQFIHRRIPNTTGIHEFMNKVISIGLLLDRVSTHPSLYWIVLKMHLKSHIPKLS